MVGAGADGLSEGEMLAEGDCEGLVEEDMDGLKLGLRLGDSDGEIDALILGDRLGDRLAEGD